MQKAPGNTVLLSKEAKKWSQWTNILILHSFYGPEGATQLVMEKQSLISYQPFAYNSTAALWNLFSLMTLATQEQFPAVLSSAGCGALMCSMMWHTFVPSIKRLTDRKKDDLKKWYSPGRAYKLWAVCQAFYVREPFCKKKTLLLTWSMTTEKQFMISITIQSLNFFVTLPFCR